MLNKKPMKKRAFRFESGGDVGTDEDYDDFLRDSRGEIVRDGNDQPIRARGSGKPAPIERKDTDYIAAPIEHREFPRPVDKPPVAEVSLVKPAPVLSGQTSPLAAPASSGMGSQAESTATQMRPPAASAAPGMPPIDSGPASPFAAFSGVTKNTPSPFPEKPAQTERPSAAQKRPQKAPAKPAGRVAAGKTAAQEAEAETTRKKLAARADLERRQRDAKPLESVNPEFNLLGGPALRGLAGLGKGLAGKLAGERAAKQAARKEPTLSPQMKDMGPADVVKKEPTLSPQRKDMGPADVVKKEPRRLTFDKGSATAPKLGQAKGPFPGDRRQLGKEGPSSAVVPKSPDRVEKYMGPAQEVRKELPKAKKQDVKSKEKKTPEKRKKKEDDDIGRFEGEGGRAFRRGGAVKSASSRGDGIASRGKTKGRYI